MGAYSTSGLESMAITAGSVAAGRHGGRAGAESLFLIYKHKVEIVDWEWEDV